MGSMTFEEYQKKAMSTALGASDDFVEGLLYRTLGLVGEAGEIAEKVKKLIRDKGQVLSEADKTEIIKEMGDVLWYLSTLAASLDSDLEAVAQANIVKLASRMDRNLIHGDGDNR